jgi:TonB-dependent receptor
MHAYSTGQPSSPSLLARLIALLLLTQLCVAGLLAQSGTGKISGRVYDEATGRSLQGAVVRIAGSAMSDYTDADGTFDLEGLAPGNYTVQVDYVGLDPLSQQVSVAAGQAASFNAPLKSAVLQLEAFQVAETARGQALAINQQKTASGIVHIVSEETFGQMVGNNIGFALQRLPGISVNEGQDGEATGFNIRGVEGAYNSFQVDGNRAPNSGLTGRAFNASQFDASGVTNIEVIKAPTPDQDGDAIGGIINVVSRSAFQRDGRDLRLKLAGVYSDLPKKWGHTATLTWADIFSIGGKEKNLGLTATFSSSRTNRYSENQDMDWIQVTPANNPQLNLGQFGGAPVWFLEAAHWEYDTRITDKWGINGSIDFRTDEHNAFYVRPTYSRFTRKGTKFESDVDIDTRFQDAANGRKTYALLTPNSGRGTPGTAGSQGSRGWIGTEEDDRNDLYSVSFGGRHEKNVNLFTWDLFYSHSQNIVTDDTELNMLMEPENPWLLFEYRIHDIANGLVEINELTGTNQRNLGLMTEGELEDVKSKKYEDVYSARVDWERKFVQERSQFTLKTGAKYRSSAPRFNRTTSVYEMDDDFPYDRVVRSTDAVLYLKPKLFDVYPRVGQALQRTNPELFTFNNVASVQASQLADYDAKEETSALYGMGTYRFGAHTIIGGVRFERNEWSSKRFDVRIAPGNVPITTPVNRGASYDFWLPGLHTRHELRRNLILRGSFNQSYGRPNLAQLTRGRLVALNGNITDGNANLQPAFSNNYDIQLEYYRGNGGLYSVGVFYKDIEDFTFVQLSRFNTVDAEGNPQNLGPVGTFQYSVPMNGAAAKNKGVELIARQRLTFMPELLKGFTASVSATFTETDATYPNRTDGRTGLPLPGFSSYLFTSSLEYARGNFFARADYRYRDDYVEGLGSTIESDEYYSAEEKVDLEVGYRIRKGLSLFGHVTNLTKRPQVSYQGFRPFVEDTSQAGRKITMGVDYRF